MWAGSSVCRILIEWGSLTAHHCRDRSTPLPRDSRKSQGGEVWRIVRRQIFWDRWADFLREGSRSHLRLGRVA